MHSIKIWSLAMCIVYGVVPAQAKFIIYWLALAKKFAMKRCLYATFKKLMWIITHEFSISIRELFFAYHTYHISQYHAKLPHSVLWQHLAAKPCIRIEDLQLSKMLQKNKGHQGAIQTYKEGQQERRLWLAPCEPVPLPYPQ